MDVVPGSRGIMHASPQPPRAFYSGTQHHPLYVDHVTPPSQAASAKTPVIMLHGGFHNGSCYLATPDARPGWAPLFADAGRNIFVPDWPGHGRSPMAADFVTLSTVDVMQSLIVLLEQIGPAVLLVHSASGPIGWRIAERRPELIAAIVGIAPGPPANLLRDLPDDPAVIHALRNDATAGCPIYAAEDKPVWLSAAAATGFWTQTPRFPAHALDIYLRSIGPESPRILNERFNIGGRGLRIDNPANLRGCTILIVTGDRDPRHPREVDEATARYLGAEFWWLADRGIIGNGHMMMIEDNSDELAASILTWLDTNGK
jgi:pimeloyl-ACP methyl ester carboxylesterase